MEKLGSIKDMLLEQISNWVIEKVIKAGVLWVISLLNPASAFIKACKAIYDIVMFFIERGKQILDLVNAVLDTISAIVTGNIQAMANKVEGALARMIPVAISFLASLLGLGGISEKIREIIETIQKPVNAAIDWVIGKAVGLARKVGDLFKGKKRDENKEVEHDPETQLKIEAGKVAHCMPRKRSFWTAARSKRKKAARRALPPRSIKDHPVFKTLEVKDGGATWNFAFTASAKQTVTGAAKASLFSQEELEKSKPKAPGIDPTGFNSNAGNEIAGGTATGLVKLKRAWGPARSSSTRGARGWAQDVSTGRSHRGHLIGDPVGGLAVPLNLVPMHKDT